MSNRKRIACEQGIRSERGSVLVMAIFFMAILAAVGIALLVLGESNLLVHRASLSNKKSFYLAESGIENGRRGLFDANGGAETFSDRLADAAGDNGTIDFDAYALRAEYDDAGNFVGLSGYGDDEPLRDTSFLGEGFYAAFLTNDPLDGRTNKSDSNSRAMITGVGVGPNKSFKLLEAIVEPDLVIPPVPPSVVTLLGEEPYFYGGQSNAERYNGKDCYYLGGGDPHLNVPIVGTTSDEAKETAQEGMSNSPKKYESGDYSGYETGVNLTDPDDPLMTDAGLLTMDPAWNDCEFLRSLMNKLRKHATYYCDTVDCELPDPTTIDDIVFADGDLTIGPGYIGSGILAVTGELKIAGSSSWTGVVLAVGEGALIRSGGGNGVISGTTLVADIAGPNEIFGDEDDCTPVPDGDDDDEVDTDPFGNSRYEVTGGGNSDIDFCSKFLVATEPRSYDVVEFRQL